MVGESLAEQPSAEMIDHLTRDRRVLHINVSIFLLLKHLIEQFVHHGGDVGCTVGSAELLILFQLIKSIPDVDDKILNKLLSVATQVTLDLEQKLAKDLIDHSAVGIIQLQFLLFLMFLPVILDAFEIVLIFFGQLSHFLLVLLVLVDEREQLIQISSQSLHVLHLGLVL